MNPIGLVVAGWVIAAIALGFIVFKLTPAPLTAKSEVSLLGSVSARSAFWAYIFAPYAVGSAFVGIIAPASLFIPAYLADPDPDWERHMRECFYSLLITWGIFTGIYIVRQIVKKKWP